MTVTSFFQMVIAGLVVGSVYGLIALGYVTIYRCSAVVNFAQGVFAMLGALIAIELVRDQHVSYVLSAVIAIGATSILGVLIFLLVVDRVRTELVVSQLMATLGVSMLIQGVMLVLGGGYPRQLPSFTSDKPWKLAGVSIPQQGIWVILIAVVVVVVLYLINNRTMFGKKMTATANDPMAASLVGISRRVMISWAFFISAFIGLGGRSCSRRHDAHELRLGGRLRLQRLHRRGPRRLGQELGCARRRHSPGSVRDLRGRLAAVRIQGRRRLSPPAPCHVLPSLGPARLVSGGGGPMSRCGGSPAGARAPVSCSS